MVANADCRINLTEEKEEEEKEKGLSQRCLHDLSRLDGHSLWLKIAEQPPTAPPPVEAVISGVKGEKKKKRERRIGRRKSYRLDCLMSVM